MNYKAQIDSVLHYINTQIQNDWSGKPDNAFNEALAITRLMDIACLSKRTFQLMFKAYLKESAGQYIDRLRLEYALQLLKEKRMSQKEIAEKIGWANDTAFYNAFKKKYAQSPSKYKAEKFESCLETRLGKMAYTLIELPETPIIFFVFQGSYFDCSSDLFEEKNWERLYEYAKRDNLLPEKEEYWGICYDDRDITDDDKCRFYAGLTVNHLPKLKITDEVKSMYLPQTRYVVYTHEGPYDELDSFYDTILQQIPEGYELDEGLILERYLNSPADTPEEKLLTEILLPIA